MNKSILGFVGRLFIAILLFAIGDIFIEMNSNSFYLGIILNVIGIVLISGGAVILYNMVYGR